MKTYRGGESVKAGFYWNLRGWSITPFGREGGVLPGATEHRFVRVPALLLLGLAPLMGGLYVMFLPLLGFVMVATAAVTKGIELVRRSAVSRDEAHAEARRTR